MPEPKIIYHHNREATIRKNGGINFHTRSGTSVRMPVQPLYEGQERGLSMGDKVAFFFIMRGNYRVRPAAENLPEIAGRLAGGRVIAAETLEPVSSRDNDLRMEGSASLSRKERRRLVESLVAGMLEEGKWQYLLENKAITARAPNGYWNEGEHRIFWTRTLVEKTGKDPRDLTVKDFHQNRLGGLLVNYYDNSPFKAISEAYPELGIMEWEMLATPNGFYGEKENRVAATRWLVERLGKDPRDLTMKDFRQNRLEGLLVNYYDNSPFKAVSEAYPELGILPSGMKNKPHLH